jgi:molybdopterin molybdotransferase
VKQKPGKPLFFGKRNKTVVFALPGNPAAALTCFYVYVQKALNLMTGKRPEGLRRVKRRITSDFSRKGDRAQFLKAAICGDEVAVLEGQSSAMLHTYALSNALVYISLDAANHKKGDEVECLLLSN